MPKSLSEIKSSRRSRNYLSPNSPASLTLARVAKFARAVGAASRAPQIDHFRHAIEQQVHGCARERGHGRHSYRRLLAPQHPAQIGARHDGIKDHAVLLGVLMQQIQRTLRFVAVNDDLVAYRFEPLR